MSLDSTLAILEERGLSIHVDEEGKPRLHGPKEEVTDAVRAVLSAYRAEIIERFRPAPKPQPVPRRVVLLADGRDSDVEKVIEEPPALGCVRRARELAALRTGRTVAVEWLSKQGWVRYTWIRYPAKEKQHEAAQQAVA